MTDRSRSGAEPGRPGPGLIDVHSHFLTERYVTTARRAGIAQPDGTPQWPTWSEGDHLALMDEQGIERSVLSISTPGVSFARGAARRDLARHVNRVGAGLVDRRPDRFGHFAAVPLPDVDAACAEAAYALDDLGSDGIAVETNVGGVSLGDPAFGPFWGLMDERAAVVFVHPTSPPNWDVAALGIPNPMLEFLFETARVVADLSLRGMHTTYPGIRWVFTHTAGVVPLVMDRVDALRPVFLPDAGSATSLAEDVRHLWFDLAGTPFPHAAPVVADLVGSGHLVYGSDYCFTAPAAVAAQVAALDAAEPVDGIDWRTLTTRNAHDLLTAVGDPTSTSSTRPTTPDGD